MPNLPYECITRGEDELSHDVRHAVAFWLDIAEQSGETFDFARVKKLVLEVIDEVQTHNASV